MTEIHSTAVVHPGARLGEGVSVGPYSIIGEHVRIGRGTRVASHVVIEGWTEIGEDCRIFPFASIGLEPQDLKFRGEQSSVVIGHHNTIREFVTIHRGTGPGGGVTRLGDHNLLMAYVHVAHDCLVGSRVILANASTLAGHITVQDHAIIGGLSGLHQFVRIGRHAIIGGCSAVPQDIPPFVSAVGNRAKLYGLNTVGLKRNEFSEERIAAIKSAYKIIFRSRIPIKEAIEKVRGELAASPDALEMAAFIEASVASDRGICR